MAMIPTSNNRMGNLKEIFENCVLAIMGLQLMVEGIDHHNILKQRYLATGHSSIPTANSMRHAN